LSEKTHKFSFINEALSERRGNSRFRSLNALKRVADSSVSIEFDGKQYINFSSNDYLGLSNHPKLIERSNAFASSYGVGVGASRLVTGTHLIHEHIESELAKVFGTESAILFNSGYQANTSILPAVADRNSLILADKNIHNSLIQGALLSRATFKRYDHNDYDHLEKLLIKAQKRDYNRIWIVSETVFSMDGDRNNVDRLIALSNKYNSLLYSDDAHALGVLGTNGLGLNFGKEGIEISLGTFGKSFGSFGAFAACSNQMKDYLINFAGGFIYSTALPPNVIGAIEAGLEIIPIMNKERKQLLENIGYIKIKLNELGFDTLDSNSQIIPIIIGSESETIELSNRLKENGLWVSAIRPPTVKENASRLRITLSVNHTKAHIDKLLEVLSEWKRK